jgi:hypothetical protein
MGKETNELDTREDDKIRKEGGEQEQKRSEMTSLDAMEKLESIVELWQNGELDSEEALIQITTLTDSI